MGYKKDLLVYVEIRGKDEMLQRKCLIEVCKTKNYMDRIMLVSIPPPPLKKPRVKKVPGDSAQKHPRKPRKKDAGLGWENTWPGQINYDVYNRS